MRRRLEVFIPIVLLSIMVQLMAPIAAFRVVAYAATDPLYMASICSGMASSPEGSQTAPAKTQHSGANCCAFCAAGYGGAAAVDPPPLVFVTVQRQYQLSKGRRALVEPKENSAAQHDAQLTLIFEAYH
jgi:hypothetical protein